MAPTSTPSSSPRQRVIELAYDHEDWLDILRAACTVAGRIGPDGSFAGRWVLQEYARAMNLSPEQARKPGLRRLAAYGLIESTGVTSRGGKRAYYLMPDREEIEEALRELGH